VYVDSKLGPCAGEYGLAAGRVHGVATLRSPSMMQERERRHNDVTESLLSQGWAELAEGVTDESYVQAEVSARRMKAGIWGDGPP
jgi:endonuclease YncB( thermonuclease family)